MMEGQKPSIGRIVHYKLSAQDVEEYSSSLNGMRVGDACAAIVVRAFGGTSANLRLLLDGREIGWVTSAPEGDQPGQWSWPPRT
jgi:hypothetical protein